MKNILFINTFYNPDIRGGAEIICQEQAENLKKLGYNVSVLTTADKGTDTTVEKINNIKVYKVGIKNIYWPSNKNKPSTLYRSIWHIMDIYNIPMRKYVEKIVKLEKPDIAICHNLSGFSISVWDALKKHNISIIQVLHDQYLKCPKCVGVKNNSICYKQCTSCKLMRLIHPKKSNNVDAVIGVSKFVLNCFTDLEYFKQSKKYVIHNARDIPNTIKVKEWEKNEPLHLGYIGTLSKVKGIEWLIKSFMSLDINATLTIAGKGESIDFENHLKKLAQNDKRIFFTGYTKPCEHYKNIHVSIVPSLCSDSFPGSAYESCANNIPVIATNYGGIPEIIKDNINGIICNPEEPDSLKKAMLKCYQSQTFLNELSTNARESVKDMLDVDNYIKKYITIIESL